MKKQIFLLWTKPNAKYICLEPWRGVRDGMDLDYALTNKEGIISLKKKEVFEFSHNMEFIV